MERIAGFAAEVVAARTGGSQVAPFSGRAGGLSSLAEGYRVARAVDALHLARGERPVGRKIGFTNRAIWPIYDVHTPIWSFVRDASLTDPAVGEVALPRLPEMLIEPEIVLGLKAPVTADMDIAAVERAIDWWAPGFEIVFSLYPGWRLTAADAAAAYAMHGHLFVGPRRPATGHGLDALLVGMRVELDGPGGRFEGTGANALDSPLSALRFMVDALAQDADAAPLAAGEMVTTGTLVPPPPVAPGERWTYRVGDGGPGLDLTFA
jgi:2-keto-4-pentenoate hydratase